MPHPLRPWQRVGYRAKLDRPPETLPKTVKKRACDFIDFLQELRLPLPSHLGTPRLQPRVSHPAEDSGFSPLGYAVASQVPRGFSLGSHIPPGTRALAPGVCPRFQVPRGFSLGSHIPPGTGALAPWGMPSLPGTPRLQPRVSHPAKDWGFSPWGMPSLLGTPRLQPRVSHPTQPL